MKEQRATRIPSQMKTKMRVCPRCNRKKFARNLFTNEWQCQNKECKFTSRPLEKFTTPFSSNMISSENLESKEDNTSEPP